MLTKPAELRIGCIKAILSQERNLCLYPTSKEVLKNAKEAKIDLTSTIGQKQTSADSDHLSF